MMHRCIAIHNVSIGVSILQIKYLNRNALINKMLYNDSILLKMMRKSLMDYGNILVLYLRDYIIV